MIEEIERAILEHPIKIEKDITYLFIEDLFRIKEGCRDRILLGPYGDITFIRRIEKFLEENSRDLLAETLSGFAEMNISIRFVLTDVLDLLEHGLKTGKYAA